MTPLLFTCTWLLLPSSLFLTLSTGALEFYQDGLPENSEDVALRQLARYLEAPEHQHRGFQRGHLSPVLGNPTRKKHHLGFEKQTEEELLEALAGKGSLVDILSKEKLGGWNYQKQRQYNDPLNELPPERDYELPYYELSNANKPFEYPSLKLPYFVHKPSRENVNFERLQLPVDQEEPGLKHQPSFRELAPEKGMKEEPMLKFHGSYHESIDASIPEERDRDPHTPEFTYRFDDADVSEEHPFAVRPNEPRYYQDSAFSPVADNAEKSNTSGGLERGTKKEENDAMSANGAPVRSREGNLETARHQKFKDGTEIALPEPDGQTGYHPLVVPVNQDLNNDIYFIAIVAGCSAAAMFALVLISLTWCRLQRGVKAAADIEYPAYGVTGPNKDVSPSGDQRLAQSAQMYHFQHQKQQIIAMENRTSATRDPGSVSEAESDEENEEGDYTVYECPGLASTGEMEVKNPLFHDDPTPATPAQTNKEEDHI